MGRRPPSRGVIFGVWTEKRLRLEEGEMRSWNCELLAACTVVLAVAFPCFAQAQSGSATLEDLVNADEAKGTDAVPEAEAADSAPNRPAGTVARPKEGVQHPDLDKAWAEYDAAFAKAAEGIRAAITKQFDAATAKGDFDAAEKWQTALEKFEKAGEVPSEKEITSAVSSAVADYKKAKEELSKAYESVVKALTMEKKIAEAKAVRGESLAITNNERPTPRPQPVPPKPVSLEDQVLLVAVGLWHHSNGNLEEIRRDGSYVVNGDARHIASGKWALDTEDPKGPCVVRHKNNGLIDRWYVDPATPDQLVHQSGIRMQRQPNGPAGVGIRDGAKPLQPVAVLRTLASTLRNSSWTWDNNGEITFLPNDELMTKWPRGRQVIGRWYVDGTTVVASWDGWTHRLTFDLQQGTFVSIRNDGRRSGGVRRN